MVMVCCRVRDFGVLLKSCDSLPTQQLLESHMSTIQSDLRGVADAVESVASLVWIREEDTEMRRERGGRGLVDFFEV